MRTLLICSMVFFFFVGCNEKIEKEKVPLVIAPFNDVDTLAINDWWNRADNPIINLKMSLAFLLLLSLLVSQRAAEASYNIKKTFPYFRLFRPFNKKRHIPRL